MKCFKDFEVKKKSTIICFQCEKQFDIKLNFSDLQNASNVGDMVQPIQNKKA